MNKDPEELLIRALLSLILLTLFFVGPAIVAVGYWNKGQAHRQILLKGGIDMPWYRAAEVNISASEINALVRTEEKK